MLRAHPLPPHPFPPAHPQEHVHTPPRLRLLAPQGSIAGGTRLTLTGRGFPDISGPGAAGDSAEVAVAGVPCRVVSSSYSTLVCITGARTTAASASVKSIRGQFPGMRGIELEVYPNPTKTLTSKKYDTLLTTFNASTRIDNTPGG